MANKDYDDLLASFMNNSSKAYDEDKDAVKRQAESTPPSKTSGSKRSKASRAKKEQDLEARLAARKAAKKKPNNRKKRGKAMPKAAKVLLGLVMIIGVVGIVCFSVITIYGYSVVYGDKVFDLTEEKYSQNQTSFIYGTDSDGKTVEITRLHGEENRIWVDMDDMSEYLPEAFIAGEDKRFYKHHGVDWIRTIGVVIKNNNQGGSTITQQLIKNLTDENQVTYIRKFNEILQALNLERNYSKEEIIEAYLNTVYLNNGCYGVKTAAEVYFGKEVSDLNAAECASLAAITKEPSNYDPLTNPDENRERQLWFLQTMKQEGYLTEEEYQEAVDYKMVFTNSKDYKGSQIESSDEEEEKETVNSYYVDYVITSVIEDLQKNGYTAKKAKSLVYGGGLKIYTAIDFDVQNALEDVYENYKKMPDEKVQGAMVVMDYEGRVLGLVGGTGKKTANLVLNRATQSERQPGSSIKPLSVYGPALEKSLQDDNCNIYWSTMIKDSPLKIVDGEPWPHNQGGGYSGQTRTLQYGLAQSLNTISARTLDMISDAGAVDYSLDYITEKFHISTLDSVKDCDYSPMATGSVTTGVTVLEMTAAYASFGNGGYYYEPYCYYKIEDSQGNAIIEKKPEETKESSLSENTAWVMNKLLQTVMTSGTGTPYKLSGIECFGKTGTTDDDKDRWFVGGTPNYVAAVWYGYDNPKEIFYSLSDNPSGTIWNTVMKKVYSNLDDDQYETKFPETDGIVQRSYCPYCGKLRSGTGVYGWYDVNNLPGYCSGGHGSSDSGSSSSSSKDSSSSSDSSDSKETTAASDSKETTAAETTSAAPSTTEKNNGEDD